MADSTKRIMLIVVSLIAIACVIGFVFLRETTQPNTPKSSISRSQKPPTKLPMAPVAKAEDKPADAFRKPPVVPAPQTNQPSSNLSAPAIELITGDIEAETNVFKEVYIKRSRPIAINPQVLAKDGKLEPGSRLTLALFPDAKYSVTLQQVNRTPQGDLSASGILEGEEYGTFSLSTASGVTLVRLADPAAKRLFVIRCHGPDRDHYAVEIDPGKVPVPKHGIPVSTFNTTATKQGGGSP